MDNRRKSNCLGFTLIEMLTVVTMLGVLMTMVVVSMTKAQKIARKTKAEAELREMCNAWLQYQMLYSKWPKSVRGLVDIPVSADLLKPLIDPTDKRNPLGVVFLNLTLTGDAFLDPWGKPYRLSFEKEELGVHRTSALETSVFLKFAR